MAAVQFLRAKKLKGQDIIRHAARHNLRELPPESHIDASRSCLNVNLDTASTADLVALCAETIMDNVPTLRPLRKDAVRGVEIVFGLPLGSGINEQRFFRDCVGWAKLFFEVPLISAVIHHDEDSPHLHAIMIPLFDGRMIGSGLVGNRKRLEAIQADFFEKVGRRIWPDPRNVSKTPSRGYAA